jgi:two-component system response regulator AtoC
MQETADDSFRSREAGGARSPTNIGLVVCGPREPRLIALPVDGELLIGRHESCQVSLPDPMLSRYHARFILRNQTITVEDLGSRHGTWIAGKRIDKAELDVGTSVRLANVIVAVAVDQRADCAAGLPRPYGGGPEALYVGPRMQELRKLLHRLARTDLPVLLVGETGTGKELAARELHLASSRQNAALRALNCAAIPPGLVESTLFGHERGAFTGADRARGGIFEEASGGTVFLDEIGELSLSAQAALLRVLESKRISRVGTSREIDVNVRVVSATHRDLRAMSLAGEFRADILHRLSTVVVEIPPLRDRREDIVPLARHFIANDHGGRDVDPGALALLEQYDWPGNVRELRNVVARASALAQGSHVTPNDIADSLRNWQTPVSRTSQQAGKPHIKRGPLGARLKSIAHEEILRALEQTQGNQRRAAELLEMPLRTLERHLRVLRTSAAK